VHPPRIPLVQLQHLGAPAGKAEGEQVEQPQVGVVQPLRALLRGTVAPGERTSTRGPG
jgi:hypothetical protein